MAARAARLVAFLALAGAAALGLLSACSNDPGAAGADAAAACPNVPTDCPATPPSWTHDVQPIIAMYCLSCHGDGGIEQSVFNYSTYQGVYRNRAAMLTQVYQCLMPLADASPPPPRPSAAERETIVAWIACGAPDN